MKGEGFCGAVKLFCMLIVDIWDTVYLLKPHRTFSNSSEKRNYKLREKNKLREICVQIKRNRLEVG